MKRIPKADICFILEGTYPYIRGGVSSWVHQLIQSFDMFTFNILLILPEKMKNGYQYTIPDNVIHIEEIYLSGGVEKPHFVRNVNKETQHGFALLQKALEESDPEIFKEAVALIHDKKELFFIEKIMFSQMIWELLLKQYQRNAPKLSFMDYFWSWRFMHLGLLRALLAPLPEADVYHTVCTGYSGFIGAMVKVLHNKPLILTEHGIYTRERQIEISQAEWIYEKQARTISVSTKGSAFRTQWIDFFKHLSTICYLHCDEIITLYHGNQKYQLADGAKKEQMSIIPNGINVARFQKVERKVSRRPFQIALVGRVVPIKDIKTYIRALKIVKNHYLDIEAFILGPFDEDMEYYEDCSELVKLLELEDTVHFPGNVNLVEWFAHIGVVVLTSISEGQPLVILEANAAGVPVVATDVGSCSELLYGKDKVDKQLGKSGLITSISAPMETADAILSIITNQDQYDKMAECGKIRVEKYYNEEMLKQRYHDLYQRYLEKS